ncbi:unnamed protein product, partial [marine sediment metagenome]
IDISRAIAANTSAATMADGLSQRELAEISHRRGAAE